MRVSTEARRLAGRSGVEVRVRRVYWSLSADCLIERSRGFERSSDVRERSSVCR